MVGMDDVAIRPMNEAVLRPALALFRSTCSLLVSRLLLNRERNLSCVILLMFCDLLRYSEELGSENRPLVKKKRMARLSRFQRLLRVIRGGGSDLIGFCSQSPNAN